jgi:hypothetical protein
VSSSQNFEEVFDLICIVIKMRSDSNGVSPDADKNSRLPESCWQFAGNTFGVPNANHVPAPFVCRRYDVAFTLRIFSDPR